jgi:acyl-CoA reductase-like NAD-dependent aldehyde dehydrogenase
MSTKRGSTRTNRISDNPAKEPVRLEVNRTAKAFIGGKFLRSESGRTYPQVDARGRLRANVPLCSRKDARDAVVAARDAQVGWANTDAALRGQILFRVAEHLDSRRSQFVDELVDGSLGELQAAAQVDRAVERVFWYAGWADKFQQVSSSVNPVAGRYSSISESCAVGVVVAVSPAGGGLLGLIEVICAAIVNGNSVVVIADESAMLAVTFAEVIATSDVPAGVVNILTGRREELVPVLAVHNGVDALDLADLDDTDPALAISASVAATGNMKRVLRTAGQRWESTPSTLRMRSLTEVRTVWQSVGK